MRPSAGGEESNEIAPSHQSTYFGRSIEPPEFRAHEIPVSDCDAESEWRPVGEGSLAWQDEPDGFGLVRSGPRTRQSIRNEQQLRFAIKGKGKGRKSPLLAAQWKGD